MMHYVVYFFSFFPSPELNMLFLEFLHIKAVISDRSYANLKNLSLK